MLVYVDDVVAEAVEVDAAFKLYKESKRVLRGGGFKLRKFTTNVPQLRRAIDELEEFPLSSATAGFDCLDETTYAKSTLGGVQAMSPTD